jgi:hypothetical protein
VVQIQLSRGRLARFERRDGTLCFAEQSHHGVREQHPPRRAEKIVERFENLFRCLLRQEAGCVVETAL